MKALSQRSAHYFCTRPDSTVHSLGFAGHTALLLKCEISQNMWTNNSDQVPTELFLSIKFIFHIIFTCHKILFYFFQPLLAHKPPKNKQQLDLACKLQLTDHGLTHVHYGQSTGTGLQQDKQEPAVWVWFSVLVLTITSLSIKWKFNPLFRKQELWQSPP